MSRKDDPYLVEAAAKILDVLALFRAGEELSLSQVATRAKLVKSTAFRLMYTLEAKGYLERSAPRRFRRRRRCRVGFASVGAMTPFAVDVNASVTAEAARHGVDLVTAYNELDPARAVANVEDFVRVGVDLVIEYNPDEHISHVVADRCGRANIPIIAITFPVPGARLFGIDNYRAGITGGEGLGTEVKRVWSGKLDAVVFLDMQMGWPSAAQHARMTGMLDGLKNKVDVPDDLVTRLQCTTAGPAADAVVADFLKTHPRARRIAMFSFNDRNAIRAARVIERAGRADHVLMVAQGADAEGRQELRKLRGPIWGVVAHFPENFGRKLIPLALRVIEGEAAPAVVTVEHVLLTRSNLRQYYP